MAVSYSSSSSLRRVKTPRARRSAVRPPQTRLLDGRTAAVSVLAELREEVMGIAKVPRLAILHFDDAAGPGSPFIREKLRACAHIGVEVRQYALSKQISATALSARLNQFVHEAHLDGIVVQLPLPPELDRNRHGILRIIPEDRDIDCLSERWLGRLQTGRTTLKLVHGEATLLPPVVGAIAYFIEKEHIALSGKRVTIVGWGDLVGKPAAAWFLRQGATVTVATTQSHDLAAVTGSADVIVSGAGRARLITGSMVKKGAIVFDAGTSSEGGTLAGDVERESVEGKAALLSPVPGGIGPLTVAMLLRNLIVVTEGRSGRKTPRRVPSDRAMP
ncbi:MAG: bifunctional 5,10-methylenetetrahydrofolate dehydrogenase/5,10-methenyltetrahydrofolate cyclohydrolase [Candidatus Terrybacteria bacterium]|nr:bifunctional 5,10-methylenetetrahydrofolate dehydrogenase/5,10-methenyltetrahydrofolate cyclohydrolase [Candidatus Terrybacteria bacterium]